MNRRGFIAALLASAAAATLSPLEATFARTYVEMEPVTFEGINACLKQIYPPGYFAEILEQESVFRRLIREG
jgi:hypothetical protein